MCFSQYALTHLFARQDIQFESAQWDSNVGYHVSRHCHVSTVSSQRNRDLLSPSTLNQGNLAYRDKRYCYYRISSLCRITPSESTTQRDNTCVTIAGNSLLKNIPSEFMAKNLIRLPCNRCREKSARLFTQLGHECRRQCQLLQRNTVNR